jgi:DNA invertase Pin-like site-specific DNA recombinase
MAPKDGRGNGIVTALIYTRVSSDEQAREGVSLDAQLAECRRYAAGQAGHGWVIGTEYEDILSGKRDDRPRYQALLAEARRLRSEGRRAVVVVAALDRFGRKILERVRSREELKALGVPTHSVREGGEVSDLVANILASVAQEEVRRLGERVSATWQHIMGQGWYRVGGCPWGYVWRDATPEERAAGAPRKVLDVNPLTAPYTAEAFERVADGASARSVTLWIAKLPSQARGGKVMGWAAVQEIFRSPVYIGRFKQGDGDVLTRPKGRWPALIDDAIWQRVQDRIASHQRVPRQASGQYLLTGFLRCPVCGTRMRGQFLVRGSRYRCRGDHIGANANGFFCRYTADIRRVDSAILTEVCNLMAAVTSNDADFQAALRRAWRAVQQPRDGSDAVQRIRQLEGEADKTRTRLTRAAELFVDSEIDKPGYERLRDKSQAELQAIETELERLHGLKPRDELPQLEVVLRDAGGWATALRGASVPQQREVLMLLIERIVPVRLARGRYRPEIVWTPLGDALRRMIEGATTSSAA